MKILKNEGLCENNYKQCKTVVSALPRENGIQTEMEQWLDQHKKLREEIKASSLLVSSDVIESLFGRFKYALERSPQADMNRSALLIPALCGNLDHDKISHALTIANGKDVAQWEKENIPYTVRKQRMAFIKNESQKQGN